MIGQSQRSERNSVRSPIIEGRDLAKQLRLNEAELQQMAVRQQLPFSWSTRAGLYIRRNDLPSWQAAANKHRRERADAV